VQQRSRWLGFPLAVMRKFRDDHGGALTTVIAPNAFFALFPLLLVVVTVLGFLLGRDSGFQQRLLGSAWLSSPSSATWLPGGRPRSCEPRLG
jgi:membrane protein